MNLTLFSSEVFLFWDFFMVSSGFAHSKNHQQGKARAVEVDGTHILVDKLYTKKLLKKIR